MNLEQVINSSVNEFKENMLNFCKNDGEKELTPELAGKFIVFVKEQIKQIGQNTIQHYFESKDTKEKSIDYQGKKYIYKYSGKKKILSILGQIEINRSVYQQSRGGSSISPLDLQLGVDRDYLTPDVKEILLYSIAHNTPIETSNLISKCSLFDLHPTTIKRLIIDTGNNLELNKTYIDDYIRDKEEKEDIQGDIVVCSMDGVNVLLSESGKKKGRPTERPVKEKEQTTSSYKNAMCGSVSYYSQTVSEKGIYAERQSSKYIARMPEERYGTFKEEFEKEVQKIRPGVKVKILLTDAHKSIMGYIKDNPAFSDFLRLIDFFHAAEHLSLLSELIFGKSSKKGQQWYGKYREILKYHEDGVGKLIRSAEYYINCEKPGKVRKLNAEKQLRYFRKNKQYMDYSRFIENGWPIGSGVIEAACKSVVKQRMCRSGQRWTRKGGQTILTLRAYVKSNRWDGFWNAFSKDYYKNCA